jgi:hypothetical protein
MNEAVDQKIETGKKSSVTSEMEACLYAFLKPKVFIIIIFCFW